MRNKSQVWEEFDSKVATRNSEFVYVHKVACEVIHFRSIFTYATTAVGTLVACSRYSSPGGLAFAKDATALCYGLQRGTLAVSPRVQDHLMIYIYIYYRTVFHISSTLARYWEWSAPLDPPWSRIFCQESSMLGISIHFQKLTGNTPSAKSLWLKAENLSSAAFAWSSAVSRDRLTAIALSFLCSWLLVHWCCCCRCC